MREIINGIFYVMRGGCAWRLLPTDFPPWGTIYRWFATFRDDGRFEAINHTLVMADRERVGREASPTGAIIDSQSVKTTEAGGPRGYDAGKKVNGRKRHALVDTDGRGLVIEPAAQSLAPIIPLHRTRLRRCGLRWRARRRRHLGRPRDRAQGPQSNRLRRPAATLGCRALLRLDRAQQATGEGLRSHVSLRQSLPLRRLGHAPRASPRTVSMSFKTDSKDFL